MDLWETYEKWALSPGFPNNRVNLRAGTRWGASLGHLEDRSYNLKVNEVKLLEYSDGSRYLLVKDIGFDLFISIYDVDSRSLLGVRMSQAPTNDEIVKVANMVLKQRMRNVEIRIIGMQNGSPDLLTAMSRVRRDLKGRLLEVDLFGNEIRHVAIDAKTGTSYNLLLLNRIYRPGELINTAKEETFNKSRSKLLFV